MNTIDHRTLSTVSDKVMDAIKPLEKKLGVRFTRGRGSYSYTYGSLKIEIAPIGKNGKAITREESDFKNFADVFGLKASDLGRKFTSGGATFTICGLRQAARKRPILCKHENGKRYIFTVEQVTSALRRR